MPKRTRLHYDWLMKYLEDPKAAAGYLAAAVDDGTLAYEVALANVREAQSWRGKLTRLWRAWMRGKENDSRIH